jgi:hypothetical protein
MNPPIAPVPVPPEPPKPVVPPQPMSIKKLVLFLLIGLMVIAGITLAAWEEGRVGLFSSFGVRGYKRREAAALEKGKKPDFKEVFRLYQLDADKGDGEALVKIGEMYRDGKGVPQSYDKARKSWESAAAPGDVGTLLWLADKYRVGDGRALPINYPEGIRLLRRAASQDDAAAQAKLALQLLSYAEEYQMKLGFDEVLSARQQAELRSRPKIAELIDMSEEGIKKMTKEQVAEKVAAAYADLSDVLREKFNWEAYFWLSLSVASNDDADLRARREDVGSKIKDTRTIERIQGLVSKWSESDAPGSAESPFALDEAPVLDAPAISKQTLYARLEKIKELAATLPESQPEAAPAKPAGSAAAPSPQKPASLSATLAALPVASADAAATKKYVDAMYDAQVTMALRRNILIAGPQNRDGNGINYAQLSVNYEKAGLEINHCSMILTGLRKDAKLVHSDVLAYGDRLGHFLRARASFVRQLHLLCKEAANGTAYEAAALKTMDDFSKFEDKELATLNAMEAIMVKRIGDELSVVAPERAALYAQKAAEHSRAVVASLGQQDNGTIYSMLIGGTYDGWHFEFGEFREASRGQVSITNEGVVSMPFQVSVVGSVSRRQRIISMTLYFTMNYAGQLKTTGAL